MRSGIFNAQSQRPNQIPTLQLQSIHTAAMAAPKGSFGQSKKEFDRIYRINIMILMLDIII